MKKIESSQTYFISKNSKNNCCGMQKPGTQMIPFSIFFKIENIKSKLRNYWSEEKGEQSLIS